MELTEVKFESLAMGVVCLIGGEWFKKVAPMMAASLDDGRLLIHGAQVKRNGLPLLLDNATCLVCRASLRRRPENFQNSFQGATAACE